MWGTDWPAGGTAGMGQPVRILGFGQMGTEEGPWWSLMADGYSSERGTEEERLKKSGLKAQNMTLTWYKIHGQTNGPQ